MNLKLMRLTSGLLNSEKRIYQEAQSGISPTLRLLVSILTILLCALSGNAFFTGCVIAAELLRTAMMSPDSIRNVLGKVVLPVLFTAILMIPSAFLGSPRTFGTVTVKVFESVLVLSVLNEEVAWNEMTGALSGLHAPEMLVMTLDTAVRFLVLLGRYSGRLLEAVSLRRVGKKNWKNAGTGGVLGVTWLKSQAMLKANSEAMTCRCFDGTYRKNVSFRPKTKKQEKKERTVNVIYALLIPVLVAGFIYTQRIL